MQRKAFMWSPMERMAVDAECTLPPENNTNKQISKYEVAQTTVYVDGIATELPDLLSTPWPSGSLPFQDVNMVHSMASRNVIHRIDRGTCYAMHDIHMIYD